MKITETFPVDAGNISITDHDFIKHYGGNIDNSGGNCTLVKVEKGLRKVKYHIKDCWLGELKGETTIETNGEIVVGDVGYLFSNEGTVWTDFLKKTFYLRSESKHYHTINTGGDGSFEIEITIT